MPFSVGDKVRISPNSNFYKIIAESVNFSHAADEVFVIQAERILLGGQKYKQYYITPLNQNLALKYPLTAQEKDLCLVPEPKKKSSTCYICGSNNIVTFYLLGHLQFSCQNCGSAGVIYE